MCKWFKCPVCGQIKAVFPRMKTEDWHEPNYWEKKEMGKRFLKVHCPKHEKEVI